MPALISHLEVALTYGRRGWHVFPVKRGNKIPLVKDWPNRATTTEETIHEWWEKEPQANIGIITGKLSGLVVIDIDPHKGGNDSFEELERQHGRFPKTVEVLTGSGGRHLYFQYPGKAIVIQNNVSSKLGPGLDVRGEGGYVVAPPSLHKNGRTYEWEVRHHPDGVSLAPLPDWLLQILQSSPFKTSINGNSTGSEKIPEGGRNAHLTSLAGTMRRRGTSKEAMEVALLQDNAERCHPPLDANEVRRIAGSVARYRPSTEIPPFPVDVLPETVQRFVSQASEAFPCPPDFIAIPLLVLLGAAIGRSRVLEVKSGWRESSRLWSALVADPGTMKSPVFDLATTWARERQAKDWQTFFEEQKQYDRTQLEYEVALKRWKDRKSSRKLPIKEEADGPPEKPPSPTLRRTFVDDITLEALAKVLKENPRGLALISDEVSAWFMGIGQYKKNGGADRKQWLSIWAHQGLTVDRVTKGPLHIPRPFIAITGGIQPEALKDLDPEEGMRDGFIHRLLLVEPGPVTICYREDVVAEDCKADLGHLFDQLYVLCPENEDQEQHLYVPKKLTFERDAKEAWIEWYNPHCSESTQEEFPSILNGPWAKFRGYSVSLALILALAEDPNASTVNLQATLGAITLVEEYFKPHAKRLYPRMLRLKPTHFDRCQTAVLKALDHCPMRYKELRQKIGGRFKGDLVREVVDFLEASGEVPTRTPVGARKGVKEFYRRGSKGL